MEIPVISFIGWSGSGKTTFLEKLIPVLRGRGLRLALVKYDGHDFQMDKPGKDTWRFSQAGAETVAIANVRHAALLENRPLSFREICGKIENVDLIIAEGWNLPELMKIELFREHESLRAQEPEKLCAVITDRPLELEVPQFGLEDFEAVADHIIGLISSRDECWYPYARARAGLESTGGGVSVSIDGHELTMLPFVQDIIRQVNLGLLSSLRDTGLGPNSEISIRIGK